MNMVQWFSPLLYYWSVHVRGRDDNFSVDELLLEDGVFALLVGSGDEGVALILKPFADSELVLGRT